MQTFPSVQADDLHSVNLSETEQSTMNARDLKCLRSGVFELQKGDGLTFPNKNSLSYVQYGYIETEFVTRKLVNGSQF